jgi:hypothetical protein
VPSLFFPPFLLCILNFLPAVNLMFAPFGSRALNTPASPLSSKNVSPNCPPFRNTSIIPFQSLENSLRFTVKNHPRTVSRKFFYERVSHAVAVPNSSYPKTLYVKEDRFISAGASRISIDSTWLHIHRLSSIQPHRVHPSASTRIVGVRFYISVASVTHPFLPVGL